MKPNCRSLHEQAAQDEERKEDGYGKDDRIDARVEFQVHVVHDHQRCV